MNIDNDKAIRRTEMTSKRR